MGRFAPAVLNVPTLFKTVYLPFWMPARLKSSLTSFDVRLAGVVILGQSWQPPTLCLLLGPHLSSATPRLALHARAAESARATRRPNRAIARRSGVFIDPNTMNHFTEIVTDARSNTIKYNHGMRTGRRM